MVVKAYGTPAGDAPLAPLNITRRMPGAHDVQIGILFCGICHSDLHQARGEWAGTLYPCVPGHEIVGRVASVGAHVTRHRPGDLVGVGCIVDSCQHCAECNDGLENYCDSMIGTYNGPTPDAPGHTLGGYSQEVVVHERYVLKITHPEDQLAAVAPLLCAGSPPGRRCAIGDGPGQEDWRRRYRRSWPYGNQTGPCHGRACGGLYHLGVKTDRCAEARRGSGCGIAQRGRDGRPCQKLRSDPEHGGRAP